MFKVKFLSYLLSVQAKRCEQSSDNTTSRRQSEQGLSLIECLMAIVVIALTGAMMLPPLFVASATRVQNRRAEQALKLAQGEVDRIRALVEQNAQVPGNLPVDVGSVVDDLNNVAAPTSVFASMRSPTGTGAACGQTLNLPAVNEVLKIDLDGDCEPEFLMQVFREGNSTTDFDLGVRVYASSALTGPTTVRNDLQAGEASLKFTTGAGMQQTHPLAVLYTNIHATNSNQSMCNFQVHETCNP